VNIDRSSGEEAVEILINTTLVFFQSILDFGALAQHKHLFESIWSFRKEFFKVVIAFLSLIMSSIAMLG
jgi:hypothetical protein